MVKPRKSNNKNPPILSHEFIIQNHADIVSCFAMVFLIGLMVQVTSPWAYLFIAIHHNVSTSTGEQPENMFGVPQKYTTGLTDLCAVFFYFLITIVMHAVLQEYGLDKISKRLHLSKVKLTKFNDSCQLVVFYFLSALWGIDIVLRDNLLLNVNSLWLDYPVLMSFSLKLFFIGQFAYWLHCYPELYFQRAKKEEILPKIVFATVGLALTLGAYLLNFQHLAVVLIVLHYIGDTFLHGARLISFVSHNEKLRNLAFSVANTVYICAHVASIVIASLYFLYGLAQGEPSLDIAAGKFNILPVRYATLAVISLFQLYLLYAVVRKQTGRSGENSAPAVSKAKPKQKPRKKDGKKATQSEDDDLPEVDQATKKNLRSRTVKAK